MSRFTPGKKYLFMRHEFALLDKDGNQSGSVHHVGMMMEPLLNTEFIVLTCKEEHDVPVDYSDDKAKGYIFTSEELGLDLKNQYPTASYSQLSTAGDYIAKALSKDENGEPCLLKYVLAETVLSDITMEGWNHPLSHKLLSVVKEIKEAVPVHGFRFIEDEDYNKLFTDGREKLLKVVEA